MLHLVDFGVGLLALCLVSTLVMICRLFHGRHDCLRLCWNEPGCVSALDLPEARIQKLQKSVCWAPFHKAAEQRRSAMRSTQDVIDDECNKDVCSSDTRSCETLKSLKNVRQSLDHLVMVFTRGQTTTTASGPTSLTYGLPQLSWARMLASFTKDSARLQRVCREPRHSCRKLLVSWIRPERILNR